MSEQAVVFPASLPIEAAADVLMAVALENLPRTSLRQRRAINKLERNGPLARVATRRAYGKFLAEGGEDGTGASFFEWLVENWETILAMIMDIIGLFGGLGGAMGQTAPEGAEAFPFPAIDLDLLAEIGAAIEAARKSAEYLVELAKRVKDSLPQFFSDEEAST